MIYHGGCPVFKNINSLFFAIILMKITWKTYKWKKNILSLLKSMTKTSQLNDLAGKSKEDVFRRVLCPKCPFKMAAWRDLYIDCKYLPESPFFMRNCGKF